VNRTRWLATVATALAVVLGGGAALGASGSTNPASDFLGDVAERLGISKDELEGAIADASIARIDAAVAAGKLTQEEGDALKDRVRSGDLPPILPGFVGPGREFGPHPRLMWPAPIPGTDLLAAAIEYLGIDRPDLREAFRDGKSLADVAKDKGKSVDGLKEAVRDAIRERADQAVEDGLLTKTQADRLVQKISRTVDRLVDEGVGLGPKLDMGRPGYGLGPPGPFEHGDIPGEVRGADFMEIAAEYLGIGAADVHQALSEGKSLADLAKDKGKSVDGLKDALRDAIREDADQAVDDGVLTREQADRFVKRFAIAIDELVDRSLRRGWDFDFRSGRGDFELRLRVAPEGGMPRPRALSDSLFIPARGGERPRARTVDRHFVRVVGTRVAVAGLDGG
jgi:polyhydroxyalkanoate synthesis regulator phasin